MINEHGKIELINQVAGSLIGIRTEEAVGKPLDEVYTRIRRTERQNGGDKTLTILVSRKGTEYIVEEEHTSLPEMESDQSGTVIIFRDITERHRAEEALKDSRDSLESAYNALKLTQSRLLQQEKMASIGQLAAGVAHEINNPMGFISSNLRSLEKYIVKIVAYTSGMEAMLAREKTDANVKALKEKRSALQMDFIIQDIKDLIDESLEGAERVKKIVQNLKTFARLDHDDHKQADINKCIESSLNMVWNELKYKATIIKDYGEIPQTLCYPMQLNQVFVNLLVNAAHAIERQGEITVRTWAEKGSICASVTDTGCGMTQETMDHIFEPFFSTKEIGQGTGLGLSIVYDIIIKHGGEIAVLSTPGNGTTFTVHLPIVEG
jgi:two-component system NtrC family sensor kinase